MNELSRIENFVELPPRFGTAGQPSEAQFEAIARAGFKVVINLARHDSPRALADERALVERCGLAYIHIPINFKAPSVQAALAFFDALQATGEERVFVHCALNYRVSALMSVYRVLYEGVAADEARAEMLDVWTPDEVWEGYLRAVEQAQRARISA